MKTLIKNGRVIDPASQIDSRLDVLIENGKVAGLVIGLSLTLVHLLGIAFTGTSVNPARSFGPALFAGGEALSSVWVFIVAPLVGGVLAALCYKFLDGGKQED